MKPDEGATEGHRLLKINEIVRDLVVEIAFREGGTAEHLVSVTFKSKFLRLPLPTPITNRAPLQTPSPSHPQKLKILYIISNSMM